MMWSEFYLVVSGLMTLVLLIVAFPWLRSKNHAKADSLSNTQIVKQRLQELDREEREGLISAGDKAQAVDELKVALVDESAFASQKTGTAWLPLAVGATIAIATAVSVYAHVNQLAKVKHASDAMAALPELSQQLATGNGNNLSQQDMISLALALRQQIRSVPEDDSGWMVYGRLMLSLGQEVQAIEAIERAVNLAPDKKANAISLAQALMTTGDVNNLSRAQGILANLLQENAENDNLALMMAVVSAQLGDLENTAFYYNQVKSKLPQDSELVQSLINRIAELEGQVEEATFSQSGPRTTVESSQGMTEFSITISLSEAASVSLPPEGFLVVFAQDADSQNRMPAAVVKRPLSSFPLTVNLTVENAMMPQFTLDSLENVKLTARISEDENVAVAAGEWEGSVQSKVSKGRNTAISITINKELQ